MVLVSLFSAGRLKKLTFGDLGAYPDRKSESAWDDYGPVFRLMLAASKLPDVCGLMIEAHLAWTGGSAYLHRNAPLYMPGMGHPAFFNYAIVGIGRLPGAPVVSTDGKLELIRMPHAQCVPDPSYRWVLP